MSAQTTTVTLVWEVIGSELERIKARISATSPSNERLGIGIRLTEDELATLDRLTTCICKLQEAGAVATKAEEAVREEVERRVRQMEAEAMAQASAGTSR